MKHHACSRECWRDIAQFHDLNTGGCFKKKKRFFVCLFVFYLFPVFVVYLTFQDSVSKGRDQRLDKSECSLPFAFYFIHLNYLRDILESSIPLSILIFSSLKNLQNIVVIRPLLELPHGLASVAQVHLIPKINTPG